MCSPAITAEIRREFPVEYAPPPFELADVVRMHGAAYRAEYHPSFEQGRALHAIETCRTTALGGHVDQCDHCGHVEISYNSCRNRHCPKCRASQRAAWVDDRELELLPIQYFHLVFTLPEDLNRLAQYCDAEVYAILMRSAAETLQTFAHKLWDADLGIVSVLHTWGQTLQLHPHVHCLVTGGALKRDGSGFVQAPNNFLFPVRALSPVFRAIFLRELEALRAAGKLSHCPPELHDEADWKQLLIRLHRHAWVVYAEAPFDSPQHLIRYLGRYVNRIAIANYRILAVDADGVVFRYRDNRVKDPESPEAQKTMRLSGPEFIRRFLQHVLPPGFHQIRYYGLLGGSRRKANLTACRALLGLDQPEAPYIADLEGFLSKQAIDPSLCPNCGKGHLRQVFQILSFHDPPAEYAAAA
ncbi:MAG: IS91 family transposase [Thiohalocapsa sp. PB-PSB1]|jgi:predicted Zn-ribbon and HTH transcriptional regulator|nr:MAG: IS91 family transposase [Thiohalocapsa sp. PB-PSB1]QQO57502.1 MAG: IS91 family transposase [Thiohalocapsa sp. PB-PSB1]